MFPKKFEYFVRIIIMLRREKYVSIFFDTMIADPYFVVDDIIPITINIEHQMRLFSSNTIIYENNITQSLNLDILYEISNILLEHPALVSICAFKKIVHREYIDLSRNVVGALKCGEYFPLVFVFRVVNKTNNEIVIHKVPRFNLSDFHITQCLGVGAYGKVFEAIDSQMESHALKVLYNRTNIENKGDSTLREIIPLIALPKHPCMIKLEGFIFNSNDGLVLVLEHASRGRIDSLDISQVDNSKIYNMVYGLFSCVAFIHEYKIIHRDIHPSNVLVTENYEIRLIDFGSSRFIDNDMTKGVGHMDYISPDMESTGGYDEFVDEYSILKLLNFFFSKTDYILLNYLIILLLPSKYDIFISCSEICTIIECDLFSSSSKENEEYFFALSEYYQPLPLRFSTIEDCFFMDLSIYKQSYCDLVKLMDIISGKTSIFKDFVKYCEGIALDVDYLDPDYFLLANFSLEYRIQFPFSIDKIDIFYNLYIDGDDIEDIDIDAFKEIFLSAFMIYNQKELESNVDDSSLDGILSFYKKFNAVSIKYCKPEMLKASILMLNKFNLPYMEELLEYLADNKSIIACELLALRFSNMYMNNQVTQDVEKYRYYAEIAYRNGRFKAATALGIYYGMKNNTSESQKYFLIGAIYNDIISMHYVGYNRGFGKDMLKEQKWFHYLKRAADKGAHYSQMAIAKMYFFGEGIPRNFEQAFYYNYLALLKENPLSYALYGLFNFFGIQVKQDFTQARLYLEKYVEMMENRNKNLFFFPYITHIVWMCLSIIHLMNLDVRVNIEYSKFYYNKFLLSPKVIGEIEADSGETFNLDTSYKFLESLSAIPDKSEDSKVIINFLYKRMFEANEEEISSEYIEKLREDAKKYNQP